MNDGSLPLVEDIGQPMEPEASELLQEQPQTLTVPVHVIGLVRTVQAPARDGTSRNITVPNTPMGALIGEDPRRGSITFICTGNPVYLGNQRVLVESGEAAILPVGVPVTFNSKTAWYAQSTNVAGSTLSYWETVVSD